MTQYTIPEWSHLKVGNSSKNRKKMVLPHHAEQLEIATRKSFPKKSNVDQVLLFKKHMIKSNDFVGIVGTNTCTLEILPKIVSNRRSEDISDMVIRKRLVHMLSVARNIKINEGTLTNLNWEKNPILEFLIRGFTEKLFDLVRQGMPRNYKEMERDLPTIRGSLDVARQFTRHAVNPSRLACRFDELTKDIALNQKMKTTLQHLYRFSKDAQNQQRLRELLFLYTDIAIVPTTIHNHKNLKLDRTNKKWHWLVEMADLLLKNQFQSTIGGKSKGYSILFDMNKLFEEYVGRRIQTVAKKLRRLGKCELSVELQNQKKFCLYDKYGNGLFKTIPDIVLKSEGKVVHVIDTKWKHLDPKPRDLDVSNSDVYQILTYGLVHDSIQMTLLYPHSSILGKKDGIQLSGQTEEQGRNVSIRTVDLADPVREREQIEKLLLQNSTNCR